MCSLRLLHTLVECRDPSLNVLLGPAPVQLCLVPLHALHALPGLIHCALNAGNQDLQNADDLTVHMRIRVLRMPYIGSHEIV